jgi:sigma-E factor negative regulatory protein RseA
MTEQIGDQVSAFIDDELSEDEGAFLVRRMDRDAAARGRAFRYMTIGCALRGELIGPDPAILRRRIQRVLEGGAVPPLARPKRQAAQRFIKPLLGLGVAASVAVVTLGAVRFLNESRTGVSLPAASQPLVAAASRTWSEPPSYIVPQDANILETAGLNVRAVPTSLLLQHGENASGLNRLYMYSSIVAAEPEVALTPGKRETSSASVASPGAQD